MSPRRNSDALVRDLHTCHPPPAVGTEVVCRPSSGKQHPISALRVRVNTAHWHLTFHNGGGIAGTICVLATDGPALLEMLLPRAARTGWLCSEDGLHLITPGDRLYGVFGGT